MDSSVREQRVQLEEEIELQDGAGAELDQETGKQGRTFTGLLWIRADQLWSGDIPSSISFR